MKGRVGSLISAIVALLMYFSFAVMLAFLIYLSVQSLVDQPQQPAGMQPDTDDQMMELIRKKRDLVSASESCWQCVEYRNICSDDEEPNEQPGAPRPPAQP